MKQKLLLLLTALMLLSTGNAWGEDEAKGTYKYTLDFETFTGTVATGSSTDGTETLTASIQGGGQFVDYGDGFGSVFHNCGGDPRRYFLKLPSTLFTHSNTSQELSIGFWVTARGMNPSDYTYAPLFAAYANDPDFTAETYWGTNTMPMLLVPSFGTFQVNCSGYCDFGGALNTAPTAGKNTIYNTNHWYLNNQEQLATNTSGGNWLADNKWHYFTLTMTGSTVTIYMDGEVKNQWSVNGTDGQYVSGVFSHGDELDVICLGGNQAWDLGDNDKGFSFDDFMFTNEALDASAIAAIMDEKLVSSATALSDDATYPKGKEVLNTAKTTLENTSSAENRTALLAAINTFCQNNASYTHPYAVSITNGDFGMGTDYWNATNLQTWSGDWGRGGWNRWIEMATGNSGSDASIYQVTESAQPAGHYVMKINALTWNSGYTIRLGNGTTSSEYSLPNNSGTYTQYLVSYDLTATSTLKLELVYDASKGAENSWSAFDDVELLYYGNLETNTVSSIDFRTTGIAEDNNWATSGEEVTIDGDDSHTYYRYVDQNTNVVADGMLATTFNNAASSWRIQRYHGGTKVYNKTEYIALQDLKEGQIVEISCDVAPASVTNLFLVGAEGGKYIYYVTTSGDVIFGFSKNALITEINIKQSVVSATLGTNGYATFASPYALDLANLPSGLTAYKAAVDGNTVRFTQVTEAVQANTGLLLKGTASETYSIPVVASGSDISATNAFLVNTNGIEVESGYTYYGLLKNTLTFATFDPASVTIPSDKAYLKVANGGSGARLAIAFEDDATGINAIKAAEAEAQKDGKYLENGKIVIVKNGVKYSTNGQILK